MTPRRVEQNRSAPGHRTPDTTARPSGLMRQHGAGPSPASRSPARRTSGAKHLRPRTMRSNKCWSRLDYFLPVFPPDFVALPDLAESDLPAALEPVAFLLFAGMVITSSAVSVS